MSIIMTTITITLTIMDMSITTMTTSIIMSTNITTSTRTPACMKSAISSIIFLCPMW